jgi:hypothetical protein
MPLSNQPPEDFYCSQLALESNEMMAGTAVSASVWILLEYRQIWQAKATRDNTLPTSVKIWLDEQLGAVNGRLQFIRQAPYQRRYRCFISVPDAQSPRIYRFDYAEYEELINLDLKAIVENVAHYTPYLTTDPLFLVCTNGKRDRCCAKFGTALYRAFSNVVGTAVWQTTHLGGHRFAPTLMSFPEGVCYGHVTNDDIPQLLAAQQNGDFYLPRLRGRALYDAVTQVAEYYLCQQENTSRLTTFQHVNTESVNQKEWAVQFHNNEEDTLFQVDITEGEPQTINATCGTLKTKSIPTYLLKQISRLD